MQKFFQNFCKNTQKSQKRLPQRKTPWKSTQKPQKKRPKKAEKWKRNRNPRKNRKKPPKFRKTSKFRSFSKKRLHQRKIENVKFSRKFHVFRWGRRFFAKTKISAKKALYLQGFFRDFAQKSRFSQKIAKNAYPNEKRDFAKILQKFAKSQKSAIFANAAARSAATLMQASAEAEARIKGARSAPEA